MVLLSSRTWLAPVTPATRADEAGGPPPSKFYERRDNLGTPWLAASKAGFFEAVDISEALAQECVSARHDLKTDGAGVPRNVRRGHMPLRAAVGDPLDLARRPCLAAIDTLTLRRASGTEPATFLLHRRDPGSVAVAGGLIHIVPTGIFQPAADIPGATRRDFDLWLNTVREYAEELIGVEEASGKMAARLDYEEDEPYASLVKAERDGVVRFHVLGAGVDPLSLWLEILTVAVFDADGFDALFPTVVRNDEGIVLGARRRKGRLEGFPFDEEGLQEVLEDDNLSPAASGVLTLAWRHRDALRL